MDLILLNQANQEWEAFLADITEDRSREIENLNEAIESNNIHHYTATNNYNMFDQALNRLTNKYLYDEEIIETIYICYIERNLHELAFDYLNKAFNYYSKNRLAVPGILAKLKKQYPDDETIRKLKLILGNLSSQKEDDIPKILPNNLNGKSDLSEFILTEIIQASQVMIEKIESIRQITHENRYNDLLFAILKLRFPIWGWSITDQPRVGTTLVQKKGVGNSKGGKDAGSADLLIEASGRTIALLEALVLRDKIYTETHILKCFTYEKILDRYFIIVYILGDGINFIKSCKKYERHVLSTNYPNNIKIDKSFGFKDLTSEFRNVGHLMLGKTILSGEKEMFHLLINLTK